MSPTLTRGFNKVEPIIAKTMEYLAVPAVVGHEKVFMDYLHHDFDKFDGVSVVQYPGLLEIRGNTPHAAIICAHIDRHGLISIGNDEYAYAAQYMREVKYGEEHRSSRKELESIAQRFEGEPVYAYNPETGTQLGTGIIKASRNAMNNGDSVFFIEGFEEYDHNVPIAYARTARGKGDNLRGQIDNTISIGVVYALFKAGFQGTALLTTEEEIGKSWVHISKHLENEGLATQELLVIDTSPYLDDTPLNEGALIFRTRDRFASFNKHLTQRLAERCDKIDLPYHIKDQDMLDEGRPISDLGSTELGRLISERECRWSGTTIQIPTNMYHTSSETTSRKAIINYYQFLKDILIDAPMTFEITQAQA